jgi:hypothetical protein
MTSQSNLAYLKLTPPKAVKYSLQSNAEFIRMLHSLIKKTSASLEVKSSFNEGPTYIVGISSELLKSLQNNLVTLVPGIEIKHLKLNELVGSDYTKYASTANLSLSKHYALPLRIQDNYAEHDLISYIIGAVNKLSPEECISYRVNVEVFDSILGRRFKKKLNKGSNIAFKAGLSGYLLSHYLQISITLLYLLASHNLVGSLLLYALLLLISPYIRFGAKRSDHDQRLTELARTKLEEPLFKAEVQIIVSTNDQKRSDKLLSGVMTALTPLNSDQQKLIVSKSRLKHIFSESPLILSASELASLYHLPFGDGVIEDFERSQFMRLPVPLLLKNRDHDKKYNVIYGSSNYHDKETNIGLTEVERQKHVYIVGSTGSGKSSLMEYAILQDIKNNKGICLIDPHGDSAKKLLSYIPKSRIKDVVYLNPIDIKHPITINLLELPKGLDDEELLLEKDQVTESIVSIFRKMFSENEANSHRIEALLRNAIQTAFYAEDPTIFTILKLIRNFAYRNEIINKIDDEELKDYWWREYGRAGSMQQVSISKGLTGRLDRFRSSVPFKRSLGEPHSSINFEDIIESGKILICNISPELGEDTSALFGTIILAKLKLAAERRARIEESQRSPFYVYVDEFQNFSTTSFVSMLSSSRKYKLYLTMAEQSTNQQSSARLTEAILANVGTIIAFNLTSPVDTKVICPRFKPFVEASSFYSLPSHNFYMKVTASDNIDPVSAKTTPLKSPKDQESRRSEVIEASRESYTSVMLEAHI